MNLTANTGVVSAGGIAFFILEIVRRFKEFEELETYDAYAPLPIVFDIIRKGRSRGKGSS
jgi:hypothetical protein